MRPPNGGPVPQQAVRELVEEVLRVGLALLDLLSDLVEKLPEDAFPGEDPAEVVIQMVTGTLAPVADSAGAAAVREATALTGAILDRVLIDLREAARLARPV
jgi:hypothetical protein